MSTRFGRYELLERLGKGGMAEVHLARVVGPAGVARFVALKRGLHDLSEKRTRMFLDEMRLAVRLSHPNIVAVYDFGVEADGYFLALELVEGTDLLGWLQRSKEVTGVYVDCVLYMIAQVARGLDYAHRLTDSHGKPLEIVHRDVTPSNVLVSFDGAVKLADFGIARAVSELRETETATGEIKGKVRYMSPEPARGEAIDHRSDQFSLGTMLLELLTLKAAFKGDSDMASLKMVQAGVPKDWSDREAMLPRETIPLLARAMAPERDKRFPSCGELADEIELVLRRRNPGFSPTVLAALMEQKFGADRAAFRKRLSEYERGARSEPAAAVRVESGTSPSIHGEVSLPITVATPIADPRARRSRRAPLAAGGALLLAVAAGWWIVGPRTKKGEPRLRPQRRPRCRPPLRRRQRPRRCPQLRRPVT